MRQDHAGRRKTHCPKGHEYNEENTRHTSDGKRICRVCDRERKRVTSVTSVAGADMTDPPASGESAEGPVVDGKESSPSAREFTDEAGECLF